MRFKLNYYLATGLFTLICFTAQLSQAADTIQKIKATEDQIHEEMISISRQLGVTCVTCHNTANFRDGSKAEFKVALDHIQIVKLLRDNGFSGKLGQGPKADCFMCHRGVLTPDYKEVVNPLLESPITAKAKAKETEKQKKKKQQQQSAPAQD